MILAKLVEAGLVSQADLNSSRVCRPSDVWTVALDNAGSEQLRLESDGQIPVQLLQTPVENGIDRQRWTALAVLLCLALAASLVLPFPISEKRRAHLLALCAIAAGCLWWYCCTPSFLGLAMVAISVFLWTASCFSRFRTRFSMFRLGTK
jgi:hypothetical protein